MILHYDVAGFIFIYSLIKLHLENFVSTELQSVKVQSAEKKDTISVEYGKFLSQFFNRYFHELLLSKHAIGPNRPQRFRPVQQIRPWWSSPFRVEATTVGGYFVNIITFHLASFSHILFIASILLFRRKNNTVEARA